MKKNVKVRHHYLPICYLSGFCDSNEQIWTYKKIEPNSPFSNAKTNSAVIRHLYSLSIEGKEDVLENYFASEIEGPAVSALKKLRQKEFPSPIERKSLSVFFGTLFTRTPIHIEHLNNEQTKQLNIYARVIASNRDDFYRDYKRYQPKIDDSTIEEDRQAILNDDISIELRRDLLLMLMLEKGELCSQHLSKMKWVLLETSDDYPFITSDNPLYIFHPTISSGRFHQPGLGMTETRVSIPISKELTLLLFNDPKVNDGVILSFTMPGINDLIKNLNKITYMNSYQYVFANSNSKKLITCFVNLLKKAQQHN